MKIRCNEGFKDDRQALRDNDKVYRAIKGIYGSLDPKVLNNVYLKSGEASGPGPFDNIITWAHRHTPEEFYTEFVSREKRYPVYIVLGYRCEDTRALAQYLENHAPCSVIQMNGDRYCLSRKSIESCYDDLMKALS